MEPQRHDGQSGISARELMALELPPVRWAVPGLVPEGVTLLAGKPKLGKSWLTLGLCVAVATGGTALGTLSVERGGCLYLALEDNRRRLKTRLGMLLGGAPAPAGLDFYTDWPRLDQGGEEELDAWLGTHPGCRLVVVDTLKKVRARVSGNRGIYDVDYEALEPLMALADRHGAAILVVHHTRKQAAADPLDEISGSTGLSGGVDGALVLKRDRGRAEAFMHVTGRDIEEEREFALRWEADRAGWRIAGNADLYRLNEERSDVVEVLRARQRPMKVREVAEAVEGDYNATRQRLYQMGKSGELLSLGRGLYALPNWPNISNEPNGARAR